MKQPVSVQLASWCLRGVAQRGWLGHCWCNIMCRLECPLRSKDFRRRWRLSLISWRGFPSFLALLGGTYSILLLLLSCCWPLDSMYIFKVGSLSMFRTNKTKITRTRRNYLKRSRHKTLRNGRSCLHLQNKVCDQYTATTKTHPPYTKNTYFRLKQVQGRTLLFSSTYTSIHTKPHHRLGGLTRRLRLPDHRGGI